MKRFYKVFVVFIYLLGLSKLGFAQTDSHHEHKGLNGENIDKFYLPYEFSADSLIGFDEDAAWVQAQMNTNELWKQRRIVAVLKRNYIDFHFGLRTNAPNPTVQAPCTNPGFETGTLAGWTALEGTNNNSITMAGCCAAATTQAVLVGPGTDPNVPLVATVPPGGGNFACRLGQTGTGGVSYRLNQTFTVTAANSVFVYKYAVILQDGGHACSDQPFFNIKFETCNNVVIPCAQYQVAQQGSACSSGDPNFISYTNASSGAAWSYLPWQTRSFDLTNYIGQCVNIEFTVGGCVAAQGAHPGYCYIDAACDPMTLNLNGTDIPVGQTTTNMCSTVTNTLCAPPGFTSYSWTGPGATGNTNQCITTSTSGTYSVTLGMQGTSCQSPVLYSTFNIVPNPLANFTFSTNPCANGLSVPFVNTTSVNGGPPISNYYWDFNNDGITDNTTQSPTNTYTTPGTYSVQLLVSNGGCTDSITQVLSVSSAINADFLTSNACLNTVTNFTSAASPTTGIAAHDWDYGDGTPHGTGANPSHTYTTPGIKNVTYTVTNSSGCHGIITKTLTVYPNPTAAISANTVCLGLATTFGNTSSVSAPDNITNWSWDFDNNGIVDNTTQTPTNTYTVAGTYSVELSVVTNNGCRDSVLIPVNVGAVPIATFNPVGACTNSNILLNNTSSVSAPNNITSYSWNFDTGASPATSTSANPSPLIYSTSGVKNITLNIMSNTSCTATITRTVSINPSPVPDFTYANKCINNQPVSFDGSTTTIPVGTNTVYAWSFGDGGTFSSTASAITTHTYLLAGTYNATLSVTSDLGCQATVVKQVQIYPKPLVRIANASACDQVAMTFSAQTLANSGTITNWFWDFNNSISTIEANGQSANNTFSGAGTQTIGLVSVTNNGCRDTIKKTIYVNYNPSPMFSVNDPDGCPKHCVTFTDATPAITGPARISQWQWSLGDGSSVTNPTNASVNHCYTNNSSSQLAQFDISLTVTTDSGCVNTNNKLAYVTVFPVPVASYYVSPSPGSILTPLITFNNQSHDYVKWWWTFGDGPIKIDSTHINPEHFYNDVTAATYYSNIIIENQYGCRDTAIVPVEIAPEFTFYIPNAFTPTNEDGINDYFNGSGIGIAHYEMWIFDRWGAMIFYTDDITKGWNGKVQGKNAEGKQDVYTWKVKLKDVLGKKHEYIGHVTLLK